MRVTVLRHSREVASTLALSTEATRRARLPRALEGQARDALDLRHAVGRQVRRALVRALAFRRVLAKVDIADQLADDLEIDHACPAPSRSGRKRTQRLAQPDRPHIRVHAQRAAQAPAAPLPAADPAAANPTSARPPRPAAPRPPSGMRPAFPAGSGCRIVSMAMPPKGSSSRFDAKSKLARAILQNAETPRGNFRANPVARQNREGPRSSGSCHVTGSGAGGHGGVRHIPPALALLAPGAACPRR